MRVWRLATGIHNHIDGEGARLFGGRWNSIGVPIVYAASHVALALVEQLVHFEAAELPDCFRAFAISLPDDAPVEMLTPLLPMRSLLWTQRYGDAWANSLRSAALLVPSIVVPPSLAPGDIPVDERNVLLNPRHPSATSWQVTETAFRVDPRLLGSARV